MRRRQLDARQLYAVRRTGSAGEYANRRNYFRRRRLGSVRHVGYGGSIGFYRGTDGGQNTRISRQEDRRPRDEARDAVHPDFPGGDPAARRPRNGKQSGPRRDLEPRAARLLADSLRVYRSLG